jgi:hypothetical protein
METLNHAVMSTHTVISLWSYAAEQLDVIHRVDGVSTVLRSRQAVQQSLPPLKVPRKICTFCIGTFQKWRCNKGMAWMMAATI